MKFTKDKIKNYIKSMKKRINKYDLKQRQYSEDYPLGGMIEPYDIEKEKELTN